MQQQGKTAPPREAPQDWITWSLALGSFAAVFMLTMVFLCQYAILVQNHYRVVVLRDHQRALEREQDLMLLQAQALSSLEPLEGVVTQRLKMVAPAILSFTAINLPLDIDVFGQAHQTPHFK